MGGRVLRARTWMGRACGRPSAWARRVPWANALVVLAWLGSAGCRDLLGPSEEMVTPPPVAPTADDAATAATTAAADGGGAAVDDPGRGLDADMRESLAAAAPACKVDVCPPSPSACLQAACIDDRCGELPVPAGTSCEMPAAAPADDGGAAAAAAAALPPVETVCDGAGACVACLLDEARGQGETDVDCGGAGCRAAGALCATNQACGSDADCRSGVCDEGLSLCVGASCRDEVQNGTADKPEPDVDCGGPCLPRQCDRGQGCFADGDCESGHCDRPDGAARGVCCGTPCEGRCFACEPGTGACVAIASGDDPQDECPGPTNWCDGEGACSQCGNRVRDGDESGRDCGGGSCAPCPDGEGCQRGSDCQSCLCEDGACVAPRCDNQVQDGCESGIDCGGPCGNSCGAGEACSFKGDCASLRCQEGTCVGP